MSTWSKVHEAKRCAETIEMRMWNPETRKTTRPLLAAEEDLRVNTLQPIQGLIARFLFLCSLRTEQGYEHWGLMRKHGEAKGKRVLRDAHRDLATQLCSVPISALWEESTLNQEAAEREKMVIRRMPEDSALAPPGTETTLKEHIKLVWMTLRDLSKRAADDQAS